MAHMIVAMSPSHAEAPSAPLTGPSVGGPHSQLLQRGATGMGPYSGSGGTVTGGSSSGTGSGSSGYKPFVVMQSQYHDGASQASELPPHAAGAKGPISAQSPRQTHHQQPRQQQQQQQNRREGASHSGPTSQVCANCGTTRTPLWRRGPSGETICNACGLYFKARHTTRPVKLKREQGVKGGRDAARKAGSSTAPRAGTAPAPETEKDGHSECEGTCPGDGHCNGTGGSRACAGCPAYNNRLASRNRGAASSSNDEPVAKSEYIEVISDQHVCKNCGTSVTPLWRRDDNGNTICNACGLYFRLHGQHRPVFMKKQLIKRRKRYNTVAPQGFVDEAGQSGASSPGSSQQHIPGTPPAHSAQLPSAHTSPPLASATAASGPAPSGPIHPQPGPSQVPSQVPPQAHAQAHAQAPPQPETAKPQEWQTAAKPAEWAPPYRSPNRSPTAFGAGRVLPNPALPPAPAPGPGPGPGPGRVAGAVPPSTLPPIHMHGPATPVLPSRHDQDPQQRLQQPAAVQSPPPPPPPPVQQQRKKMDDEEYVPPPIDFTRAFRRADSSSSSSSSSLNSVLLRAPSSNPTTGPAPATTSSTITAPAEPRRLPGIQHITQGYNPSGSPSSSPATGHKRGRSDDDHSLRIQSILNDDVPQQAHQHHHSPQQQHQQQQQFSPQSTDHASTASHDVASNRELLELLKADEGSESIREYILAKRKKFEEKVVKHRRRLAETEELIRICDEKLRAFDSE